MAVRDEVQPPGQAGSVRPSLPALARVFLRIGSSTFGGMWAATQALEAELVRRLRWLTAEEQRALMIAATLIPAPKFLSFGGLVGFRLRGWAGCVVALAALLTPGALAVLVGVALLSPEVLGPAVVPLQRAVGVAIIGLLIGNAARQVASSEARGRQRVVGVGLALAVAVAALSGVPLLLAAAVGLAVGAVVMPAGGGRA